MKSIRKISATLLALVMIMTGLITPTQFARSQGKKDPGHQQPPVSKTKLEVMEGSGDFKQWVKTLTITSAEKLLFAWYTDEPGVTSAGWMVSDKDFSPPPWTSPTQSPHVIASGHLAPVPQKGQGATFLIDFTKFAPKTPPKNPTSYWVYIMTKNAQRQPVGLPSAAVKIIYRAPSQGAADLSGIPIDKPAPMPVEINLHTFKVNKTNEGEGDDDPYLFIVAIYSDGTTVNPLDLAHSSVRIESPSTTHNNLLMDAHENEPRSGKSYSIPYFVGHFENSILPLQGGLGMQTAMNLSRVGILVIVMEEDNTSDAAANAARKALVHNLRNELNAAIQSGSTPNISALQAKIKDKMIAAAEKETLKDWFAPWGLLDVPDSDDFIGSNFAIFSYAQILDAGIKGLPINLVCASSEGSYTIIGSISRK
ncbi:MAG: hypothetical protein L0Z53_15935 [Acidobacteriales bacterium]|nr:hypothetical protein [Terriglobales bacterium]